MRKPPKAGKGASSPYDEDFSRVFREAGDLVSRHLSDPRRKRLTRFRRPAALAPMFRGGAPRGGKPSAKVWRELGKVLDAGVLLHHPAYLGHQVAPPFPIAAAAAGIGAAVNQGMAAWELSPAASLLERQVLRWLSDLAGLGPRAAGAFVPGGTIGNLYGILAARNRAADGAAWEKGADRRQRLRILCSDQVHYSVERACGVLGLGARAAVKVPTDGRFRMTADAAEEAVRSCRRRGERPTALVATAGTTSTGSFDPLGPLAAVARRHGLWLHVDGAHGASLLLSRRHRALLSGIDRADSVAWDPHKMLFMPMSASAILFRRGMDMDALFRQDAPYIFGTAGDIPASLNPGERSILCSRSWDALKVWLSFRRYGTAVFATMIDRAIKVTRALHAAVLSSDDLEPLHEPECNILCFRYRWSGARDAELDRLNFALRNAVNRSGRAWLTTTVLRGRRVLRAVVINPLTTEEDARKLLADLRRIAKALRA